MANAGLGDGSVFGVNTKGSLLTVQKSLPLLARPASVILMASSTIHRGADAPYLTPGRRPMAAARRSLLRLTRADPRSGMPARLGRQRPPAGQHRSTRPRDRQPPHHQNQRTNGLNPAGSGTRPLLTRMAVVARGQAATGRRHWPLADASEAVAS